jgi:mannose-1-phosphate guanylyltransferase
MNALLLSAGLGERLRPITNDLPKCLLPMTIRGTLLKYWLELLVEAKVDKIFVNVFWLKDKIIEYVNTLDKSLKDHVVIYTEDELEPVGKVLTNLYSCLGHSFFIINSDTYIEKERVFLFIKSAKVSLKQPLCLGVSFQKDVFGKSVLLLSKEGVILSFTEKPNNCFGFSYAGIMLMSYSAVEECASKGLSHWELTKEIVSFFEGRMSSFDVGDIIDIGGSIEQFTKAQGVLND